MSATEPKKALRTVVNAGLGISAVILVFCVLLGSMSIAALTRSRSELVDELDPASTAVARLEALAVDQQNRLRGYVLLADSEYPDLIDSDRTSTQQEFVSIRELLDSRDSALRSLASLERSLEEWQRVHVDPLLERPPGSDDLLLDAIEESSAAFGEIRANFDALDAQLNLDRENARADLDRAASTLSATLAGIAALLGLVILTVWFGLRRLVLDPLSETVADARIIVAGDLDHVPSTTGLAELAEVSAALDQVRVALVEQLREVEAREAQLERSNAELEQFAYVASHDLQEPLRKVASFCQMLERRYKGQLDERADTYISFAVDGATRMQELINDLLAFSRVGRSTERFAEVDLEQVLDLAIRNLGTAIDDAGAEILRGPVPHIVGDRSLLVALFQNLIGNAVKFRSATRPVVRIEATDRGELVEFTIADNGIGIPEEYRDRIFVVFQRLHGRSEYEGTGIGLALCRKIVEFHGGEISMEDNDDSGATVRFTLRHQTELAGAAAGAADIEGAPS